MVSPNGEAEAESIPSVKDLASSEPSLRRQSLTAIIAHLTARSPSIPPTPTQCLQLWRGFSVALYMHDSKNAISVQNLIMTLASTLTTVYEKDVELQLQSSSKDRQASSNEAEAGAAEQWPWLSRWTTAFWETLCREWSGIDQWRMNKYLLLIRFVVRETFAVLSSQHSNTAPPANPTTQTSTPANTAMEVDSLLSSQLEVLRSLPLSPRDRKVPDGLRLHVLDIWLDELETILSNADQNAEYDELEMQLMQPVRELAREALSKSVRMKAKEEVRVCDEGLAGRVS